MNARSESTQTLAVHAKAFGELQAYLVNASTDLFGHYRLPVEHTLGGAVSTPGPSAMAVIGYAADHVRGSVLLLTSRAMVRALQPIELRTTLPPDDATLRDVLGEFANMLLGRVKNKLATRAVAPLLATPTTILGEDLALPAPRSGLSAWHRFSSAGGDIFVRLDATFEAGFVLGPEAEPGPDALREGDMVMFEAEE